MKSPSPIATRYSWRGVPFVDLSDDDMFLAEKTAALRERNSRRNGQFDRRVATHFDIELTGIYGELVLPRFLGDFDFTPATLVSDKAPDYRGCEIRATPHPFGRLRFKGRHKFRDDPGDTLKMFNPFVLVIACPHDIPRFYLPGWLYGNEIKNNGEPYQGLGTQADGWWIVQGKLRPMETLECPA